jgi:hypothetical protein
MNTNNPETTPPELTDRIRDFCLTISSESEPMYLSVEPFEIPLINECFDVVQSRIRRDGGCSVNGWLMWEWPNIMLDAEFHCVWRDSTGRLREIPPRQDGETRVLFLPDPAKPVTNDLVDNIRSPLFMHPDVIEFMNASTQITEMANQSPLVPANPPLTGMRHVFDSAMVGPLIMKKNELAQRLILLQQQFTTGQ